jgi:hypothetical protein
VGVGVAFDGDGDGDGDLVVSALTVRRCGKERAT